jgi:hypothetical protein
VFDDINNIAEVNDVGWSKRDIGTIVRVPTSGAIALLGYAFYIATATAAVVEEGSLWSKEACF